MNPGIYLHNAQLLYMLSEQWTSGIFSSESDSPFLNPAKDAAVYLLPQLHNLTNIN
jgi:hypothetical protein